MQTVTTRARFNSIGLENETVCNCVLQYCRANQEHSAAVLLLSKVNNIRYFKSKLSSGAQGLFHPLFQLEVCSSHLHKYKSQEYCSESPEHCQAATPHASGAAYPEINRRHAIKNYKEGSVHFCRSCMHPDGKQLSMQAGASA